MKSKKTIEVDRYKEEKKERRGLKTDLMLLVVVLLYLAQDIHAVHLKDIIASSEFSFYVQRV